MRASRRAQTDRTDIGNEKATAEAFLPGGWFRTGDVGCLDSEGFLYLKSRAKEVRASR